jgi:hypothetical protein
MRHDCFRSVTGDSECVEMQAMAIQWMKQDINDGADATLDPSMSSSDQRNG